jgi:hypothetical protein
MTIEATEEQGNKKGRKPRGGNVLVDKMTGALEIEGESPEDAALREAQRIAVAATAGDMPEQPQQPEPQAPQLFERPVATPPKLSPKAAREEGLAERMKQNKPSPSTKRMGDLGRKLPGAERAKIHKRVDGGNLAYIGEYTENDLSQSQDVESFIGRYLRPAYGSGEYQITGVDAHGREFDMGIVQLLNPLNETKETPPQVSSEVPVMGQIVGRLMDKALQPAPIPQVMAAPPAANPVKMLGELHELQQRMLPPPAAPSTPKDNALLLAIVGGLTTVASSLVTVMAQPKPMDPLMMALLKKLTDDEPRGGGGGGALPPPLPPPDPTEQLKNLAAVVQSLRGGESPKSDNNQLVEYLMRDRMSPGDVLKLVNDAKGERGTDDFKKSMENMGIMLNAVNQLRSHTEPGAGAGFWDAIGALFQNKELAGSVADAIRSKKQEPAQLQQQPRALPDPLVLRARELAAKRLMIEEAELARREQALNPSSPQLRQPAQRQPSVRPPAATIESALPQMPDLEPQAAAPGKQPQLPSDIGDYINSYIEAQDEASLVETTVQLLFALQQTEDWKPYSAVIFKLIAHSDKARFLHYMASFFVGLRTINLIEEGITQRIMQALANNFSTIAEIVAAELEKGEGGDGDGSGDGDGEGDDEGDEMGDEDLLRLGEEEPLTVT